MFAVLAASAGDVPFAVIGLLAAGAGATELHGVALLREGESRGMNWLVGSQPYLLLVIWCYCGLRILHFEVPTLPEGMGELAVLNARQWNMSVEAYFRTLNAITVGVLAVVALVYQGAMTIYYWRRRDPVARALVGE
ncbi:MAG: hypothetical protein HZC55_11845 [Verrucomicrobia bacterium]|nr:hypothetical protein [Verrucomicrobiota bacterium]